MSEEYVLLSMLAREWGIDKSTVRKYVKRKGYDFVRVRGDDRTHQVVLGLSVENAELLREARSQDGYSTRSESSERGGNSRLIENGTGFFYLVQLEPRFIPSRVKLGYASDPERRLGAYRTTHPQATILKTWPCRSTWEQTAIDSLTAEHCTPSGGEVFECTDIENMIHRGEIFFSCLPHLL